MAQLKFIRAFEYLVQVDDDSIMRVETILYNNDISYEASKDLADRVIEPILLLASREMPHDEYASTPN